MNTRSRRRITLSNSNHPFIKEMMTRENVIPKRKVFQEFPRESSVHSGKFAEVHFSRKPSNIQKVVSPLSSLRTPRKDMKESKFVTPTQKNRKNMKNYAPSQVRTPNALHFLARSPNCALKIQRIADIGDVHDKAYHEVLIHKSLAQTAGDCPGFTMLHTWFKSFHPAEKLKKRRTAYSKNIKNEKKLKKKLFQDEDEDDDEEEGEEGNKEYYMNFVLERADITLDRYLKKRKSISQYAFQNILFQLLFSLQIMQRECGFVHHDLHKKNILIKALDPTTILKFRLTDGLEWVARENLVKITDFGHSRVEMSSGHIVYNKSRPCTAIFDASKDIMMIRSNFRGCKILWEDKRTKELKNRLWRKMGKVRVTEDVRNLLYHPFFDSLRYNEESRSPGEKIICFEESSKWRKRKKKRSSHGFRKPQFLSKKKKKKREVEVINVKNQKNVSGKKRKRFDGEADFESGGSRNKKRKISNNMTAKKTKNMTPPPIVSNPKNYGGNYKNFEF